MKDCSFHLRPPQSSVYLDDDESSERAEQRDVVDEAPAAVRVGSGRLELRRQGCELGGGDLVSDGGAEHGDGSVQQQFLTFLFPQDSQRLLCHHASRRNSDRSMQNLLLHIQNSLSLCAIQVLLPLNRNGRLSRVPISASHLPALTQVSPNRKQRLCSHVPVRPYTGEWESYVDHTTSC